jgi:hypothetical protein
MLEWLDEVAGPGYSQAVLWTLLALLLLVVLLVAFKLVRPLMHGTFVVGGRNRKARLAITDATALDSQRRLVLVRRDDVEHLLLIGGSSDIIVEQDIRIGQPRRTATPAEREPAAPAPPVAAPAPSTPSAPPAPQVVAPPPRTRAAEPGRLPPAPRPAAERAGPPPRVAEPQPRPPVVRPPAPRNPPAPQHTVNAESAGDVRSSAPAAPARAPAVAAPIDDLDSALLKELEVSLDGDEANANAPKPSLDDEMARLLGELSNPRR